MPQSTLLQFIVPDMDCKSCVASIEIAVKRIDAKAVVTANLETKHVAIGSTLEVGNIAAAIEHAGFTVKKS